MRQPRLHIQVQLWDPTGRTTYRRRWRSHSWLTAYISALWSLATITNQNVKDTGGAARTYGPNVAGDHLKYSAPALTPSHGPVVGKSDQVVTLADFNLIDQCWEGVGVGQLTHGITTFTVDIATAARQYLRIQRNFINNSGASITVKEAGLIFQFEDSGAVHRTALAARDVLTTPQAVPHLGAISITYELYTEP